MEQVKSKRKDLFLLAFNEIEVEKGFNPRINYGDIDALAQSIIENGIKNPLRGFKNKNGKYVLTDGHRRLKATEIALQTSPEILIPFIIDTSNKSIEQRVIDVMVCNDGLKLNPLEEAEIVRRLVNYGMSDTDIANRTGKTPVYISNLKLLNSAPQKIKNLILQDTISSTLAMDLLRNTENYEEAVEKIENAVSIAHTEGKTKVMKRDLEKSQGKVNSYAEIKKCMKTAIKQNKPVREDKRELYNFVQQIINGELTKEQLNNLFFEE